MAKQKSYLITGGYGLVGSALANTLDGKITLLVRSDQNKDRIKKKGVKVLKKDLNQVKEKDLKGIDVIYHCASTVDNYHILTDPYIDTTSNINGTIKLLEACKNLKKKPKIIYFSTFFVYGNSYDQTKKPITESSATDPLGLYPITKLAAENIIKLYSRLYKIPFLTLRLTNVYSEHELYNNKRKGVINFLTMSMVKGDSINVYTGGNFRRDYINLEDVISAVNFLESKDIKNDSFLIGYGKPVWFKDMINYIHKLTDHKSELIEIESPEFHKVVGIGNFVANTSKLNKLGWKAKIDYKTGLKRIVDTYKKLV